MSGRRAKLKGALWLVLVCIVAVGISANFSMFARLVPFSTEKKIAAAIPFGARASPCNRGAGARALNKLVARLYPIEPGDAEFQIAVTAVHNPEVNAYAALGGQVFVNQGLIEQAESPEELAGVLAHEIEHVRRRHVLENVIVRLGTYGALKLIFSDAPSTADLAQMILGLQYGKAQEHEADQGGLERLARAEVDARGFMSFFERMQQRAPDKMDFLSDHPSDASRAELAAQYIGRNSRPVLSGAEWKELKSVCR